MLIFLLFLLDILIFILTFITPFIYAPSLSSKPVTVDENLTKKNVTIHSRYFEDKTQKLSINEISSKKFEKRWIPIKTKRKAFGYSPSVFWVRFTLENKSPKDMLLYLHQDLAQLDFITLYVPGANGFSLVETGDSKPFHKRPIKHRLFVVLSQLPILADKPIQN